MRNDLSILSYLHLLVAATILPFLGLVAYGYHSELQVEATHARATVRRLADIAAANASESVAEDRRFLKGLARDPSVRALTSSACQGTLRDFQELHPQFASLLLADADGRVVCATLPGPRPAASVSIAERDWFRRIRDGESFAIGGPAIGAFSGRWTAILGQAVRDEQGRLTGLVALTLDLFRYQPLPAQAGLPPGAVVTLLASGGTILARSEEPERWVGRNTNGANRIEDLQAATAEEEEYVDVDGVRRLCAFTPVPGTPWIAEAGIPAAAAFAAVKARAVRGGVVVALVIAAATGLALVVGRIVVMPVRKLADATRALAEGKLKTWLSPEGPREVVEVAKQFNHMLDVRSRTEAALGESQKRLQALFDNIRDGILLVDSQARHVDANPALCELLRYTREEMLRMSLPDDVQPELHQKLNETWLRFLAQGRLEGEFTCRRKDGTTVDVEYRAVAHFMPDLHLCTVRDITERRRSDKELKTRTQHLKSLSHRLVEVQESERRALARELHDRTGQNLTALNLHLSTIRQQLSPDAADIRSRVADSMALVEATVEAVRNVMADLRPPVLEDYGLLAGLQWYGRMFSERTGLSATVTGAEPSPRLPPVVETALFRIAQEACTNVAKHANATRLEIALDFGPEVARLIIADDGCGFDPLAERQAGAEWGLTIMEERAEAVGATLRMESAPGNGTRTVVELPCFGDGPPAGAASRDMPESLPEAAGRRAARLQRTGSYPWTGAERRSALRLKNWRIAADRPTGAES